MPASKKFARKHLVRVDVTDELITAALPKDSSHCMIAEAVKAVVPDAKAVSVDLATIRWTNAAARERYTYLTPPIAQRALINFDQGLPVEPFSFTLRGMAQITSVKSKRDRDQVASGDSPGKPTLGKAKLQHPRLFEDVGGEQRVTQPPGVPVKIGGTPPPNGALTNARGRIRAFGLRQLKP